MSARTENGALSLATTSNSRVDFFFKILRDTPEETTLSLLERSWNEDPLDTLRLIFHLRDCRGIGKGEKAQFHRCISWLMQNYPQHVTCNLQHLPFYGSYKDLLFLFGTPLENDMLMLFSNQLRDDKAKLSDPDPKIQNSITLVAKWAPSEGCAYDSKHSAASKMATHLMTKKVNYRKEYLVPLRKHLKIVETQMCSGQWDTIDFSRVPSCAFKRYTKAFKKHAPEQFAAFISRVKAGEAKINTAQLFPHQIVEPYLKHFSSGHGSAGIYVDVDETIEASWKCFVDQMRKKWAGRSLGNALVMADVSGSMSGEPICVSVSLGMLIAELNTGPFAGKWLTFSATPVMEELKGNTVRDRIDSMMKPGWMMNTNIQAAFDLILTNMKMFSVPPEQQVQTLIVLSDMQFDQCCTGRNAERTNHEEMRRKYQEAGFKIPQVVYWNLRGATVDFPVSANEENVALISGFSPSILELFLEDRQISPLAYVKKVVNSERYARITLAS